MKEDAKKQGEEGIPKQKPRSANFPVFSLEKGLEMSNSLYKKYLKTTVPWELAVKTLGYSPKSSGGLQTTATLRYYGLIDVEGLGKNKKIRISDNAYNILIDTRVVSSNRDMAIRNAALTPSIFQKLKEQFPEAIPADDVLEHELKTTYKILPGSVKDVINVFTETMAFAKVYNSDIMTPEKREEFDKNPPKPGDKFMNNSATLENVERETKAREIANYPAGKGVTFRIIAIGTGKITPSAIDKLRAKLDIDKEFLTDEADNDSKSSGN